MIAREPSLATPIVCSLVAAIAFSIARINGMPDGPRNLFVFIGVVFALWAFVTGGDWLLYRFSINIRTLREGWMSGEIKLAHAIAGLDPRQLSAYERVSPSLMTEVRLGRGNQQNNHALITSMGRIDYTWIRGYLEDCEPTFPYLKPQHGLPESLERDQIMWFANEMVRVELADPAIGNQGAKWRVPMSQVWDKFGFV